MIKKLIQQNSTILKGLAQVQSHIFQLWAGCVVFINLIFVLSKKNQYTTWTSKYAGKLAKNLFLINLNGYRT
jgi:hypothetical protein